MTTPTATIDTKALPITRQPTIALKLNIKDLRRQADQQALLSEQSQIQAKAMELELRRRETLETQLEEWPFTLDWEQAATLLKNLPGWIDQSDPDILYAYLKLRLNSPQNQDLAKPWGYKLHAIAYQHASEWRAANWAGELDALRRELRMLPDSIDQSNPYTIQRHLLDVLTSPSGSKHAITKYWHTFMFQLSYKHAFQWRKDHWGSQQEAVTRALLSIPDNVEKSDPGEVCEYLQDTVAYPSDGNTESWEQFIRDETSRYCKTIR